MAVRVLVGAVDGQPRVPAAALYDSVTGMMLGPLIEHDDPAGKAEAFLDWIGRDGAVDAALARRVLIAEPPMGDGRDARHYSQADLMCLYAAWASEHVGPDGLLLVPEGAAS